MQRTRLAKKGAHVDEQQVVARRLVSPGDNERVWLAVLATAAPREQLVRPILGNDKLVHCSVLAHRRRHGALARIELVEALLVKGHCQLGVPLRGSLLVRRHDVRIESLLAPLKAQTRFNALLELLAREAACVPLHASVPTVPAPVALDEH